MIVDIVPIGVCSRSIQDHGSALAVFGPSQHVHLQIPEAELRGFFTMRFNRTIKGLLCQWLDPFSATGTDPECRSAPCSIGFSTITLWYCLATTLGVRYLYGFSVVTIAYDDIACR